MGVSKHAVAAWGEHRWTWGRRGRGGDFELVIDLTCHLEGELQVEQVHEHSFWALGGWYQRW